MADTDPILAAVPRRLAVWSEDARGLVVLERPRPTTTGLKGAGDLISWWLSPRRVRLDALGSTAWRRLDGRATVAEVAEALAAEHGIEDAQGRAAHFVRLLRREGYLAVDAHLPAAVEPR
ncbi:MAG: PqqD family protein [Holophagae bacterium]|nr:MAG: PqqD family protein [Holophagae bacterium]